MINKLHKIKQEVLSVIDKVKSDEDLKKLQIKYLGRKGELTKFLRGISGLNAEDKKNIGKLANELKNELTKKFNSAKRIIEQSGGGEDFVDVTLPGKSREIGHLHPISRLQEELEDIFKSMGFMVATGPELESEYYNFEALNIPASHPARDMQDTFYIAPNDAKGRQDNMSGKPDLVMRTHTSPMQIRAMQKYGAPLKCVVPGRAFRAEALDAVHEHTFDQLEGLMIGENISITNLIAVLKEMLSQIFKQEVKLRVRPGYFPFVEPGLEVDVFCTICGGKGCPSCKHTGWLEMVGSGMVHPKVLKYGGIDPDKYTGFAFGLGVTRLAMMRYGVNDIRYFNSGDLRFINQF